ncbi:integral membrane protein TerC family protein [Asticcacaulis biprosthecium C19]|uniref:Integral membrane protein TerC family protein n=1 Tax=Asticcacaulis biprosthecium C19 TaxID=715226 RepID=F4QLJ1_9CAUL|nr:TerC family protein [Asticcacaulis biprosthecium]EGF93489.1 integral membrane protein TerC family protein [Asticcacaulis biprosthecium C19]
MILSLPDLPDLSEVPAMAHSLLAQWDKPPTSPEDIGSPLLWTLFGAFVVIALIIDFSAMKRQGAHKVSLGEAALWSFIWIAASMAFMAFLWWRMGGGSGDAALEAFAQHKALEFLTGYLVEKALAVDNIFVFLMLFTYFAVPAEFQKRALMIGILAALVLRGALILVGAWLINEFHWVLYLFGAFLVFTGIKMWLAAGKEADLDSNPALNWVRKSFAISPTYDGEKFFTRVNRKTMATPLLVVVLLIGIVDVVFAVDSIPAIFAITTDPFIVLTSNVMAILGLRAMYFLLAGVHERFHLLPYGLAMVLVLIGAKMLLIDLYKIPIQWSLGATAVILTLTVLLSLMIKPKSAKPHGAFPFEGKEEAPDEKPRL